MKSPVWSAATGCRGACLAVPLHKGILSKEHIFRCAQVCLGDVLDWPLILRGSRWALVASIAGSCVIRHRTAVLRPQLPADRCFVTARQAAETPACGLGAYSGEHEQCSRSIGICSLGSKYARFPRSLASRSEPAPVPQGLPWRSGRSAPDSSERQTSCSSRGTSDCIRSCREFPEVSTAAAAINSRYALAGSGKRFERVRIPRTRRAGLACPRRSGALRLNSEVQLNQRLTKS